MATDFVHSEEITQRIVDILESALPADWTSTSGTDVPLRMIQHGDLRDGILADPSEVLPCVLVRSLGIVPTGRSGIGGVRENDERFRIVMVRRFQDCTDASGSRETNMVRARQRYAKELCKALFGDPNKRLAIVGDGGSRTLLTLTCTDSSGAQVIDTEFTGLDYDGSTDDVRSVIAMRGDLWAIAVDVSVRTRTGGH